jgi:CheY-like chemotaxis protein
MEEFNACAASLQVNLWVPGGFGSTQSSLPFGPPASKGEHTPFSPQRLRVYCEADLGSNHGINDNKSKKFMRATETATFPYLPEHPCPPETFPAEDSAAETSFYYGLRTGMAPAPKQVLVIDDDHLVRKLVVETVRKAGYRADSAQDGEEGWTALCRISYDLLITDHEMPRLTGLMLIERLRAVSMAPPCILISGCMPGSDGALMKIVYPGAILGKPFRTSALVGLIHDFLSTSV